MEPVREGIAYSYTGFEDIEEEFSSALDQSLEPSGPAMLLDVVGSLGLPVGCVALDVGSGEGRYAIPLAERFGFTVLGIDPVQAQIDRSNHAKTDATVGVQERVEFRLGRAEQLPVDDDSSSLVFCRDTLTLVPDLGTAYREFRRVLRADGRVVVYQLFPTERMEPREGEWLLGRPVAEVTATAAEGHMAAAGLRIVECISLGPEWGEYAEETTGKGARLLLHSARLLREPERYIEKFGEAAYREKLADAWWHIYRMIGKLEGRIYILAR
jgi:ubiquinone/menaquinone biosynthesis C-methylase UbiE